MGVEVKGEEAKRDREGEGGSQSVHIIMNITLLNTHKQGIKCFLVYMHTKKSIQISSISHEHEQCVCVCGKVNST